LALPLRLCRGAAIRRFPINQHLRLIRWGEDGLALPTGDGRVLLINGPFVKP